MKWTSKRKSKWRTILSKNNGWKEIRSPKIYDAFVRKVIVMEEMSGKNLNHLMNAENKTETFITGIQNKQLKQEVAKLLVENFMKQVFDDGFSMLILIQESAIPYSTKEEQTQASRKTEIVHEKSSVPLLFEPPLYRRPCCAIYHQLHRFWYDGASFCRT